MSGPVAQLNSALAGRYEIDREIGAGGMATVYLARDVRHDRKVALKVLKPELGAILGVERFLAEIKVTANLQHPNLLALFDSGEANGLLFYVMPFVEGESLRAKLEREKQLSIEEAVRIATAVAGALDYAHGHGVIHRDLKPENILMQAGQPVIADFGIALAVSKAGGARITQTGLSLGTPQYMSPEQATGDRTVDGRTDIYSLAAVTYEMLAGEPPHAGPTAQSIIAKLMTEEVRPLTVLRRSVPAHVDAAVRHALEKLPADRVPTAREFSDALQGKSAAVTAAPAYAGGTTGSARLGSDSARGVRRLAVGLAVLVVALAATIAWMLMRPRATEAPAMVRVPLVLQPREEIFDAIGTPFTISSDGRLIVYVATRDGGPAKLYAHPVGDLTSTEIPGTEGAWQPAISPDGRWVAFGAGGQLKKVLVFGGGTPVTLGQISTQSMRGLSWGSSGLIVVGNTDGALRAVPQDAAQLHRIDLSRDSTINMRWPLVLPDGHSVVFVHFSSSLASSRLAMGSVDGGELTYLDTQVGTPIGFVDGRLFTVSSSGAISSVALNIRARRVTGSAVPAGEEVYLDATSGGVKAVMSAGGDLVYQGGRQANQLVVVDAHGVQSPLLQATQEYHFPRFSPDGRRVSVTITTAGGTDIWVYNRQDATLQRLTSGNGGSYERQEWTPDGKTLVFRGTPPTSTPGARQGLWKVPADHSESERPLVEPTAGMTYNEVAVSPDGTTLLFRVSGSGSIQDIWYRRLAGDTASKRLIVSPAYETGARFSPDGKWVAYQSDESSSRQVYVTPFPGPGPKHQVSTDGGEEPVWSGDGRTIFYARGRALVAASVTTAPGFTVTSRVQLFEGSFDFSYVHASYDVSRDGKEFLMVRHIGGSSQPVLLHDWQAGLHARSSGQRTSP